MSGSGLRPRRNCRGSCCSRACPRPRTGDVERADDGVSLKDGVSRDRMMPVHDPEMRHGHKSSSRRFAGHGTRGRNTKRFPRKRGDRP